VGTLTYTCKFRTSLGSYTKLPQKLCGKRLYGGSRCKQGDEMDRKDIIMATYGIEPGRGRVHRRTLVTTGSVELGGK
jgi:hypothetical protein